MLAKLFSRIYHACWYLIAAITIVAAVTVTGLRLMLPQINDYRPNLESWLSQKSGYEIRLQQIDADWDGWTPTLFLNDIEIMDRNNGNLLTKLKSAYITVKLSPDLNFRNITQLQITLNGPQLQIIREPDGSLILTKIEKMISSEDQSSNNFFTDWILHQRSIAITNATIHYIDRINEDIDMELSDVNLHLRNAPGRTQITATTNIPPEFGKTLEISIDAFGDITTPDWHGNMHVEGVQIFPMKFFTSTGDFNNLDVFSNSPVTIKLWSKWEKGRTTKIRGNILATELSIPTSTDKLEISGISSAFSFHRKATGFNAKIDINRLHTSNGEWEPATITIHGNETDVGTDRNYLITADFIKVEDFLPVLQFLQPELSLPGHDELRGVLLNNEIQVNTDSEQVIYYTCDVKSLSYEFRDSNGKINILNGKINGSNDWGQIRFSSGDAIFSLPDNFNDEIYFYELDGDFNWTYVNESLVIETNQFTAHTPHFDVSGKGKIRFSPDMDSPYLELYLNQQNLNVNQIVNYIPVNTSEKLRDWLQKALVAGEISSLDVLIRGNLNEFPFKDGQGRFQGLANIHNGTLDFSSDWQQIDNLNGKLQVENNRFDIVVDQGRMENAEIDNISISIADISADNPDVLVSGKLRGNTEIARRIIDNSPLSSSDIISEIKKRELDGDLKLQLDLKIPTSEQETTINGLLTIIDNSLSSPDLGVSLEHINGDVSFTGDTFKTESIEAKYFETPVKVNITTDDKSNLIFEISGEADNQFISSQLVHFFPGFANSYLGKIDKFISGKTGWDATISPGENNGRANDDRILTLTSNLEGMKVNLPHPLDKDKEISRFSISTIINNSNEKNIYIEYKDQIRAGIRLNVNDNYKFLRSEIAVGENEKLFDSGNGIFIHGNTDSISLSDWENIFNSLEPETGKSREQNIQVDLQVTSLSYFDQVFNNTDFRVNNLQPDLYITLEGEGINGKVVLPVNKAGPEIIATFIELRLQDTEDDRNGMDIDPRSKPPMEITVDDFSYGDIHLGKLYLATSELDDGIQINQLSFEKPGLTIDGAGSWVNNNESPKSSFDFKLRSDTMENMLSTFNYSASPVKDGKTKLKLDAVWDGSPMDFTLAGVNGSMNMKIDKGQFLDIDPSAGRLFGLLSLQSLPRRLALDFSDLFGEGFSFDEIEGTFTLVAGNAYTNNLLMTGPSADIDINGRTGLIEQDYDQTVTVTPKFSNSLPVASALFGPIGVGIGAVIYIAGELFESIPDQIDKLLRYQYSVTGSWDDPVVERIKVKTDATAENKLVQ